MWLICKDKNLLINLGKFDKFSIRENKNSKTNTTTYDICGSVFNINESMFSMQGEWHTILTFANYDEAEEIFDVLIRKIIYMEEYFDLQEYLKRKNSVKI